MSKTNENKLVPKLRFPEFQNNEEWVTDKVDSLFRLQDGYPFSSSDFTNTQKEAKQVVRISDINNQNKNREKVYISVSRAKELGIEKCKVQKGDLLLSLTGAAGFNFFIWNADDAYINQRTIKLVPKKQENKGLIILLEPLIHSKINAIGTGQNNNLSKDALKEIEFPFPQPNEQQKIATCLSSLDDVIEAESQKLELLKEHKKGLLQNLFPQEGEKVPKLRFKEFEDSGEWDEKVVEDYFIVSSSKRVLQQDWTNQGVPFYRTRELVSLSKNEPFRSEVFISEELFSELQKNYGIPTVGDFLVSGVGTLGICYQVQANDKFYFKDGNVLWFKIKKGLNSTYFKYCFQSDHIQSQIIGQTSKSTVGTYTIQNAKKTKFWYPPTIKEQEKIAACLSSIDDLIKAQSKKIEALKLHKKGLLQGLFPDINEENPSNSMEVENDRN